MTAKTRRRLTRSAATTALDLAGMVLLSGGVWLIYRPAGFIVAGALLLVTSWRLAP